MRIIMITWIPMVLLFSNLFTINVMHTLGQCLPDQKSVFLHIRSELTYNSLTSTKLVLWSIIAGFNVSLLLKLPSLSVIRLDGIAFSAPFPDFFADFTNLTVLSLAGCDFSGTVPQKVFQVPTLQTIDLSFNEMLGGSLPDFPKNGSLKSLTLYGTMFSGNLPESIGNLRLLSHLDLAYCDFSGAISVSITKLTNLVGLRLHGNHFSGWIPPLKLVKNLTYINLSNNDFTGEIPSSHWDGLNNLKNLDLSENSFSGPIPASLFFLPSLTTLSLYANKFSGQMIDLQNVTSPLELLDLSSNNLEGTIPSFFFQLRNLTSLYLSSNKLFGQMIDLQNVTSPLKLLDLSSNNLEGTIPPFFFQLQNLTSLDLSSNKFNGTVHLTKFRNPENIKSLDISDNSLVIETTISETELPLLPQFERLRLASCNIQTHMKEPMEYETLNVLDLNSNMLSGQVPQPPRDAEYLDLSNNNFSMIPPDIGEQIPYVFFFSIAKNRVSGRISSSWCRTAHLEVLDLSYNALHGTIPSCLVQNNSNLAVMNLKGNHLSGEISQKFQHSCSLETLDLSQNLLEGQLPPSLVNCTKLKVLNLAKNRISASEEKHSCHHFDIYISVALGFAAGLGGIFVPLLMSNKWRSYYNKKIDGVISKVFFQKGQGRRKNYR
nr:receptor-like protein 12 [Ipomoea batatas]